MNKKFLVITSPERGPGLGKLAKTFAELYDCDVTIVDHNQGIIEFLKLKPDCVLIGDAEPVTNISPKYIIGCQTYTDIKRSATPNQIIKKTGWMSSSEEDYLQLPYSPEQFSLCFGLE